MPTTTPALIADSATSGLPPGNHRAPRPARPTTSASTSPSPASATPTSTPCARSGAPAHFPLTAGHEIAGTVVARSATRSPATPSATGSASAASSTRAASASRARTARRSSAPSPPSAPTTPRATTASWTMGGYAKQVVVSERFVLRIPDAIDLDVAAPLLCAGITTYSPLRRWGAGTGRSVAVVGVGGLGPHGRQDRRRHGRRPSPCSPASTGQGRTTPWRSARRDTSRRPTTADASRRPRGTFDIVLNTVSADIADRRLPAAAQAAPVSW